jgi:hypothetical protein
MIAEEDDCNLLTNCLGGFVVLGAESALFFIFYFVLDLASFSAISI